MNFFKDCSCLPIKINIENKPGVTGPLGQITDSVRDGHLAPAAGRSLPHCSL